MLNCTVEFLGHHRPAYVGQFATSIYARRRGARCGVSASASRRRIRRFSLGVRSSYPHKCKRPCTR